MVSMAFIVLGFLTNTHACVINFAVLPQEQFVFITGNWGNNIFLETGHYLSAEGPGLI